MHEMAEAGREGLLSDNADGVPTPFLVDHFGQYVQLSRSWLHRLNLLFLCHQTALNCLNITQINHPSRHNNRPNPKDPPFLDP